MNCQSFEEWISDYLDGRLGGAERSDFESHRAACGDCRELFKQIQEVVALCRAFPEAEPPVTLTDRILSATLGEKRRIPLRAYLDLSRLRLILTPQFAVGAALVLCCIGLVSGFVLPTSGSAGVAPETVLSRVDAYSHKIYRQGIKLYNAKNELVAEYNYLKTALFTEIDYHLSQLTGQVRETPEKPNPQPQQKPAPKQEKRSSLLDFFASSRALEAADKAQGGFPS
jgi:hypothetical protein